MTTEAITTITNIELPDSNHVVLQWKVTSGTFVQKGQTIGYSCKLDHKKDTILPTTSSSSTTRSYKRPKKRARIQSNHNTKNNNNNSKSSTTTTKTGFLGSLLQGGQAASVTQGKRTSSTTSSISTSTSSSKDEVASTNHSNQAHKTGADTPASCPSPSTKLKTTPKNNTAVPAPTPIVAPQDGLIQIIITADDDDDKMDHKSLIIATIQPCLHPTIMDGLCVVCGQRVQLQTTVASLDTNNSTKLPFKQNQLTLKGGVTMLVSQQEAQDLAHDSCEKLKQQRKLSLVLDLDHTLVHATADVRANQYKAKGQEEIRTLLLPFQNRVTLHYLKLRPHVKEFFNQVEEMYQVSVYTAGTRAYAEQVILVLSRHLVGCTRDQVDLQQLHLKLVQAKQELQRAQLLQKATSTIKKKKKNETNVNGDEKETTLAKDANVSTTVHESCTKEQPPPPPSSAPKEETTKTGTGHVIPTTIDLTNEKIPKKQKAVVSDAKETKQTNGKESEPPSSKDTASAVEPPKKKKKGVSFAASLPQHERKMPTVTELEQRVQDLEKQFQEAQELEQEAMEKCRKLFGSRIVSRSDTTGDGDDVNVINMKKSLKRLCDGGTMTAIVDDREDVWFESSNNNGEPPSNLLLVKPYHWKPFVGFADVNNTSGTLDFGSNMDNNSNKEDEQLLWTTDILKRLHKQFYDTPANKTRTVPCVLDQMRRKVLEGKHLVLSGLVPLHKQQQQQQQRQGMAPRRRPSIVRYAESLGAQISNQVQANTTHVVAARDGTDKTLQARAVKNCIVVKPLWLTECLWTLTLRDVTPHLFPQTTQQVVVGKFSSSSEEEEDDDDFAAELESEMMDM